MRLIAILLLTGEHLPTLLKTIDYHIDMSCTKRNKLGALNLVTHRETVSILIDRGQSSPISANDDVMKLIESKSPYSGRHDDMVCLNNVLQSFWQGHSHRCNHFATKALQIKNIGAQTRVYILFYAALNAFRGIKNNNGSGSQFLKVKPLYKDAMDALQFASELSQANFGNKVGNCILLICICQECKVATFQLTNDFSFCS